MPAPWGRLGAVCTEAMAEKSIFDVQCCDSSQQAELKRPGKRRKRVDE